MKQKSILYALLLMCSFGSLSAAPKAAATKPLDQDTLTSIEMARDYYYELNKKCTVVHTPIPTVVEGVKNISMSLDGDWYFKPVAKEGFEKEPFKAADWNVLPVPSEWSMYGYKNEPNQWAAFYKEFEMPADWKNKRVIIQFGTVQSECRIYLNGKYVGDHVGSMTQFEKELTAHIKPGVNSIEMYVKSDSKSELAAKISHYAKHQVGGILRSVTLFAVPEYHINDMFCDATLNDELSEGQVDISLAFNKKVRNNHSFKVTIKKRGIYGIDNLNEVVYQESFKGSNHKVTLEKPELWHAEHPYLYSLELQMYRGSKLVQTIEKKIGFRHIEIKGNVLLVNNEPVKIHGISRHSVNGYDGRALVDTAILRKDIEFYRNSNCNLIRTSHYIPDQYLLDLCDMYGLFLEVEAPVCWNSEADTKEVTDKLFYPFKSMVIRDRSHPSVLVWSVANESRWGNRFYPCILYAKEITPYIPINFSHSEYQGIKRYSDLGVKHYPGWEGLRKYENHFRPMLFGEALHLNCYNTSENITDPALRDLWGDYLKFFVDNMQESPAVAGLAIWTGIDEIFYPLNEAPCGYGPFGILDIYKREKPEAWHMKMGYSPIVMLSKQFQADGDETLVLIENRYNVTNAKEVQMLWEDGEHKGCVHANVPPISQGAVKIPHKMEGDTLKLIARDARGFDIAIWKIPRKFSGSTIMPALSKMAGVEVATTEAQYTVNAANVEYVFSRTTGDVVSIKKDGKAITKSPINMYIIPLYSDQEEINFIPQDVPNKNVGFKSASLEGWEFISESFEMVDNKAVITVTGKYGKLPIVYTYTIDSEGRFNVDYLMSIKEVDYAFRQMGIGFDLDRSYDQICWSRKSTWTHYPADHIGRTNGVAKAFYPETLYDYISKREYPKHSYAVEGNKHGSNDFRSTKHNVVTCEFSSSSLPKFTVESNGRQHIRSWVEDGKTKFLLANYSNGGNEHYLRYNSTRTRYTPHIKGDGGDVVGWLQIDFNAE